MTRKEAIAAIFLLPLGSWRGLRAQSANTGERGAHGLKEPVGLASLTIDLDQWTKVTVKRGGKMVVLGMDEVFKALAAAEVK